MAANPNTVLASTPVSVHHPLSARKLIGAALGPLLGLVFWYAPLPLADEAHRAIAIVVFLIVYRIAEPIDHGITALGARLSNHVRGINPA